MLNFSFASFFSKNVGYSRYKRAQVWWFILEGRDRRIVVYGQPRQKRESVSKIAGLAIYTCNPSYSGSRNRKIMV
jgi:hypothetical protein